jgi:hypothetical protein
VSYLSEYEKICKEIQALEEQSKEISKKKKILVQKAKDAGEECAREVLAQEWGSTWDLDKWPAIHLDRVQKGFSYAVNSQLTAALNIRKSWSGWEQTLTISLRGLKDPVCRVSCQRSASLSGEELLWSLYKEAQFWAHKEGLTPFLPDSEEDLLRHEARREMLSALARRKNTPAKDKQSAHKEAKVLGARIKAQQSVQRLLYRADMIAGTRRELEGIPERIRSAGDIPLESTGVRSMSVVLGNGLKVVVTTDTNGYRESMSWECLDMDGDMIMRGRGLRVDSKNRSKSCAAEIEKSIARSIKKHLPTKG